jgi:cytochrome c oxidase assembly factor CtaG
MHLVLSHWSASLAVLTAWLVVAAAHLFGVRGLAAGYRRRGPGGGRAAAEPSPGAGSEGAPGYLAREALIFQAGLLTAALALLSPLGYWSHRIIWVRSLQDLLLVNVAPALIVIGAPWLALRYTVRPDTVPRHADRDQEVAAQAAAGWPLVSVLVFVAFSVAWCVWHLAGPYDAALAHPLVYAAEVVTYLGLGIVFWLQLVGSRPYVPRLAPLRRVMALAATIAVGTILAMVLVFGSRVAYYSYVTGPHQAVGVLADQQLAGAVLWTLMLPSYVIAGIALLVRWLNEEDANAVGAGLDRLLKPAKPAWPTRPGLR